MAEQLTDYVSNPFKPNVRANPTSDGSADRDSDPTCIKISLTISLKTRTLNQSSFLHT